MHFLKQFLKRLYDSNFYDTNTLVLVPTSDE